MAGQHIAVRVREVDAVGRGEGKAAASLGVAGCHLLRAQRRHLHDGHPYGGGRLPRLRERA